MGDNSKIEWTDHTFNPWIGCTNVSPGCDHCYAEAMAKRYGWAEWGNHPRKRTSDATWKQPFAWDRAAARDGTRPFVFCASLADVFDNQINPGWRRGLFDVIDATRNLVWLLLTKRPQNIAGQITMLGHFPPNVALGCTIVNQTEADRNVPMLLEATRKFSPLFAFVSCEPLLGPIDLKGWCQPGWEGDRRRQIPAPSLSWVIAGGESGPRARPSHPDWFRSLRDQCEAADVPFLFKQHGEWVEEGYAGQDDGPSVPWRVWHEGRFVVTDEAPVDVMGDSASVFVARAGKIKAGRTLDGRTHDGFPHGFERAA